MQLASCSLQSNGKKKTNRQDKVRQDNKRRGKILGQETAKGMVKVNAEVPLSEMFGYTTQLRSMSSGRATSTMEPAFFAKVPQKVQEEIIKR